MAGTSPAMTNRWMIQNHEASVFIAGRILCNRILVSLLRKPSAKLRKVGLDSSDIRYVVISHAHGDHYGGADYLKQKFNPRLVMSEIDWDALEETQRDPLFGTKRNPLFGEPPKRDRSVADGDTITLGETTLKLYVIPGHTLGTLATVFTVHECALATKASIGDDTPGAK
jgi:glyoxylase-like metal-dependent hydrolase (beta-lactamase superfamily II)